MDAYAAVKKRHTATVYNHQMLPNPVAFRTSLDFLGCRYNDETGHIRITSFYQDYPYILKIAKTIATNRTETISQHTCEKIRDELWPDYCGLPWFLTAQFSESVLWQVVCVLPNVWPDADFYCDVISDVAVWRYAHRKCMHCIYAIPSQTSGTQAAVTDAAAVASPAGAADVASPTQELTAALADATMGSQTVLARIDEGGESDWEELSEVGVTA